LGAAVEQTVNDLGSLDIVVANAGIVSAGPLEEVSDQMWQRLVDTNLTGVFHTLRADIPVMRRQRFGRIVVTSLSAEQTTSNPTTCASSCTRRAPPAVPRVWN
jgi:NAD(P)-dependent dehydrogenase (short-subunit alcohol dehydrogenase family)